MYSGHVGENPAISRWRSCAVRACVHVWCTKYQTKMYVDTYRNELIKCRDYWLCRVLWSLNTFIEELQLYTSCVGISIGTTNQVTYGALQ